MTSRLESSLSAFSGVDQPTRRRKQGPAHAHTWDLASVPMPASADEPRYLTTFDRDVGGGE